ncbi:MAG: bifunctional 4-hydroxy-2-oxoglutarate aldolase/2-dehydro-3-deoxy-phosphogluconate aldolase [Acidobacteriaceae bacterium]|nr:bifunctional 4-hydroxy-2-oxoglutarate aldolase/2-dehydro-3-deoxy-phosphogluconate aldolase [Acidobacteriaceae bacterium]
MTKLDMLTTIQKAGIMPAVRASSADDALFASEAVFSSGIPLVEITMTTPGAVGVISQLLRTASGVIVGAGTVLNLETARACVEAGAGFLTSPGFDPELAEFAAQHGLAIIPGALTPSEIIMATKARAAFVKVFPCASLGGPSYIRALRGPFPDTPFVASGGVTQLTAADYIHAGADVLGIGSELLPREAIRNRNLRRIHELARRFIEMVKQGRDAKLANAQH